MIFAIYARSGSSAVNARSLQIAPADSRNCNLWSRSFTCPFLCFARARYATMCPWHELAAERRERERVSAPRARACRLDLSKRSVGNTVMGQFALELFGARRCAPRTDETFVFSTSFTLIYNAMPRCLAPRMGPLKLSSAFYTSCLPVIYSCCMSRNRVYALPCSTRAPCMFYAVYAFSKSFPSYSTP